MIKRQANKWFAHQRIDENAEVNLFCFVFAGGSPSFFAPWKKYFPEYINVIPVLYPAREKRTKEPMPEEVCQLVSQFRKDNEEYLKKPYAIWGHCSGSLIGLEVAYEESKENNPPVSFIVSGCEAPEYALNRLQIREDFSQVKDEDILNDLLLFNLMSEEMIADKTFKDYFLPIYRSDLTMFSKYKCSEEIKLSCPAMILNGSEDKMIKTECMKAWRNRFEDHIEFETLSGGHYFVNDHVSEITDKIAGFIKTEMV